MSAILKANNTETPCEAAEHYRDSVWGRPTCTVTIKASAAEIAALLPNNAPWSLIEREDVLDESGKPTGQTVDHERDMSEYSLAGDITDHRDGTESAKKGKTTETELSSATVTALVGQSITPKRAAKLRPVIEAAATSLPDGEAAKAVELFPAWAYPVSYIVGNRVSDGSKLYKCLQAHTSQADWKPEDSPSLWVGISDPAEEWPEWSQPVGSTDAYSKGAKVSYNSKHWTSNVDANVWEPGVYGWSEVTV